MRRTKTVTSLVVAVGALWSATGCAPSVRHLKAVDALTQPCAAAAPQSRVLQVIVMDESGIRLPGVSITAAWVGAAIRTLQTDANGRAEVEAQQGPAKLQVQLSGFAPVEVTDVIVEPGCRATFAVLLRVSIDCRHAECG